MLRGSAASAASGRARRWDASAAATSVGKDLGKDHGQGAKEGGQAKKKSAGRSMVDDMFRDSCLHPEEGKQDSRYTEGDTDCPICQGLLRKWCKYPEEAYTDSRYTKGDTICPVCDGLLMALHDRSKKKEEQRVWERAGHGNAWENVGLHGATRRHNHGRAYCFCKGEQELPRTEKQCATQRQVEHGEGDMVRQYEVGRRFEREAQRLDRTTGAREDSWAQAAAWIRASAVQGYPPAQLGLAMLLMEGHGVPADPAQAVVMLRQAAPNDADAAFELGGCYAQGKGVVRDDGAAGGWWRRAAEMGHMGAMAAIQTLTSTASVSELAKLTIIRWKAKAGDPEAQFQLAGMLFDGNGIAQNEKESAHVYRLAARQGHAGAQCALGLCCLYGRGCKVDPVEALQWLEGAAQQGHGPAMEELAVMYQEGSEVTVDLEKAASLLRGAKAWHKHRLFQFYLSEAGPRGGLIAASAQEIEPHLAHVESKLSEVRTSMAVLTIARVALAVIMSNQYKRRPESLQMISIDEWAHRRKPMDDLDDDIRTKGEVVCVLMGLDPHRMKPDEALELSQDLNAIRDKVSAHLGPRTRSGTPESILSGGGGGAPVGVSKWKTAKAKVVQGKRSDSPSITDIAQQRMNTALLELPYVRAQVESSTPIYEMDYVDFVIRYDRETGSMAAVSVDKRLVPSAPPPGSLIVVPAAHDARTILTAAEKTLAEIGEDAEVLRIRRKRIINEERSPTDEEKRSLEMLRERQSRARTALTLAQKAVQHQDREMEKSGADRAVNTAKDALRSANLIRESRVKRARGRVSEIEDGDAAAQFEVGCRYMVGEGVERNLGLAVYWFQRAVDQAEPLAMVALGICYRRGLGTPTVDHARGLKLLEQAASHGVALAHVYLAEIHRNGFGFDSRDALREIDHLRAALASSQIGEGAFSAAGNRMGELRAHASGTGAAGPQEVIGLVRRENPFLIEREPLVRDDARALRLFVDASISSCVAHGDRYIPAVTNLGEMLEFRKGDLPAPDANGRVVPVSRGDKDSAAEEKYKLAAKATFDDPRANVHFAPPASRGRDERALSNLRALPAHLGDMHGTGFSWRENLERIEGHLGDVLTRSERYDYMLKGALREGAMGALGAFTAEAEFPN